MSSDAHLDRIRVLASRGLAIAGVTFNLVLVIFCAMASIGLKSLAEGYVTNAGGLPSPEHFTAILGQSLGAEQSMILGTRMYWWVHAWASGVFAAGFALLTVAGLRWAWLRLVRLTD